MRLGLGDLVPFLKFGAIGVVNTFLHSLIVVVAHGSFGVQVIVSHFIAFGIVNAVSYLLNSYLVFRKPISWSGYIKFIAVSGFSLGATIAIAGLCEMGGLDYRVGLVLVILISPPVTYILQKTFTFQKV